jgi:hypothetical protein
MLPEYDFSGGARGKRHPEVTDLLQQEYPYLVDEDSVFQERIQYDKNSFVHRLGKLL